MRSSRARRGCRACGRLAGALGVTHVLNCTDDLEDAHVGSFEYHRLPAKDVAQEDLSVHFEGANAFIRGALSDPANSVLVHCFEGKSRSATIVAQYLMESTRANLSDTLKGMKAAHPDTKPNEGFTVSYTHLTLPTNREV